MTFKQHIPGFISGVDPVSFPFSSLDELLQNEIIRRWATDPAFYRFSLSDKDTLMAEMDGGKKWWVVGFIKDGDATSLVLPAWTVPTKGGPV